MVRTKDIVQTVILKAINHEAYDALMSSKKHIQFMRPKAAMNQKVGRKFTTYDGYCKEVNVELKFDKKIIQS